MKDDALGSEDRRRLEELASRLEAAFGQDLLSVVLYGSAARSDHFGQGSSDLNVAVILKDISLASLERGTAASRGWSQAGNRPLFFLSPEWIEGSRDVFPIEFFDIIDSHRVIRGSDPFAGLTVSLENLRLQCESELKMKLIHLRTGYMEMHEDSGMLARLLAASYASVIAVFRGVLRAARRSVPAQGEEVVREIAALSGIETAPFSEVAAIKKGGPGAASVAVKPLFKRYYEQIETLARSVDAGFDKGATR